MAIFVFIIIFGIIVLIIIKKSLSNLSVNIPNIIITIKKDGGTDVVTEKMKPDIKYIVDADTGITTNNELSVKYPNDENIVNKLPENKTEKSECGCGVKNENKKLTYDFTPREKEYEKTFVNENNFDPYMHYRQHQEYVKTYLEDPKTRGYNVGDMYAKATDIGVDKREDLFNYPKPKGYTFDKYDE
jgi:hypothetical protein